MVAPAQTEQKSSGELAFEHYLRTGEQLTVDQWRERFEVKFNPNHDERGRFTFAFGGSASARRGSSARVGHTPSVRASKPAHAPIALDSLSKACETATGDPGTISKGQGDKYGGVSYGPYQLSSKQGTASEFVNSPEAQRWADKFKELKPGTEAFNAQWRAVAANDPAGFGAAQKAFIDRSSYGLAESKLAQSPITDIRRASPVVKAVVYSTAVQHGAAGIVKASVAKTDRLLKRGDPKWQATLISNIYQVRIARFMKKFRDLTKQGDTVSAKTYFNVATNRLPSERDNALAILAWQ